MLSNISVASHFFIYILPLSHSTKGIEKLMLNSGAFGSQNSG